MGRYHNEVIYGGSYYMGRFLKIGTLTKRAHHNQHDMIIRMEERHVSIYRSRSCNHHTL